MVADIITEKRDEIVALCRKYRVERLDLFGSAVTDAWNPESSDVDFLVDLGEYSDDYASRFFSLRRALERLTGQAVDLVSVGGLDGSWIKDEIESTKVSVYDARYDQLVA